jgi:hypothetical protein
MLKSNNIKTAVNKVKSMPISCSRLTEVDWKGLRCIEKTIRRTLEGADKLKLAEASWTGLDLNWHRATPTVF